MFQTNCDDFESRLNAECDAIVTAIRRRQQQLIANARREKTFKQQAYRDQITQCTSKVHRTTGLLQYSVEVMKESDQTAFLQVRCSAIRASKMLFLHQQRLYIAAETLQIFTINIICRD